MAQSCTRQGVDVTCDDGRRGVFAGDAIIWADGTRSSLASPHPSVIIGNKSSVIVGHGVFVGQGKGMVPMENPSAPEQGTLPGARRRLVLLLSCMRRGQTPTAARQNRETATRDSPDANVLRYEPDDARRNRLTGRIAL